MLEEERNRKIIELYLRAWNTQEAIADMFGIDKATISRLLQNRQMSEMQQDFKPSLRVYTNGSGGDWQGDREARKRASETTNGNRLGKSFRGCRFGTAE